MCGDEVDECTCLLLPTLDLSDENSTITPPSLPTFTPRFPTQMKWLPGADRQSTSGTLDSCVAQPT